MVSPPAIDERDIMIASEITRLPAVLAVISSPSRMLTPELISVPSVRVNRDRPALRNTHPRAARTNITARDTPFLGTSARALLSVGAARIFRACTSGRPELIIVEN